MCLYAFVHFDISITSISFSSATHSNFINIMFTISIYFKPMLSILPYNTRKKGKKTAAAPGTPFFSPYILCPVAYTLFYRSPFYTPIFL